MQLEDAKGQFSQFVKSLQNEITNKMQGFDADLNTNEDNWERKDHVGNNGGGGITRALTGKVFENAGVNLSLIHI